MLLCGISPSFAAVPALTAEQLASIRHAVSEIIRAEMKSKNIEGLSIVDVMPKFFNMFVGPLSAMFFIGMFLPRCTARSG